MKGDNCPFPHVRVGPRDGVCRDFAVLGYCDKGVDCDKQHVRECPDFAEKGTCPNPKCKLPHVIRANKRRADANTAKASAQSTALLSSSEIGSAYTDPLPASQPPITGDNAKIGDEFISLTFNESESEESDEDEEEDEEEEEENGNDDEEENDPELQDGPVSDD